MRILGIDPGSRLTGYGCVDWDGQKFAHVDHGVLKVAKTSGKAEVPLEQRLLLIYQGLSDVIQRLKPQVLVVEKVFFAKNAVSSLKLGQARGAAVLTGMIHGLEFQEYAPTEVKRAVSGYGQAEKEQIAKIIQIILNQKEFNNFDASDALALAICHALVGTRNASLRPEQSRSRKKKMTLAESLGLA